MASEITPGKSRAALVLDIIKLVFDIMQTVSFMMFIEEEGIQIRGFGIMSLMRENLVDEVETQLEALKEQVQNLETFCDSWGWFAPYMKPTYANYVQAAYDQIDAWEAWVAAKKAERDKAIIRIVSSPTNAEIWIDDENSNLLTPQTFDDLSPGDHTIKLKYVSSRRGQLEYEDTITVEKGKTKEFRFVLEEVS
ncbi:MAG: hypothetical protein DRP85_05405 [Candidatus Makaraimicrobium thalassicum]|nr:MAG: hypothetical protein DRP85_05405 [Candidatus Omnitrophota bacterium]